MQLHELHPNHKNAKSKRVGRGGKKGTYSGRGMKGQKSRSGTRFQPIVRELLKRYHKIRGYRGSRSPSAFHKKQPVVVVNVGMLEKAFQQNETVTPTALEGRKIVRLPAGKAKIHIKVLGDGDVTKPLNLQGLLVSKTAQSKIEKAGGKILD